jgi:hypothetical protein
MNPFAVWSEICRLLKAALEYRRIKRGAEWHRRKFDRMFLGK